MTAALFYDYLFLLDPTLRHLFRKEMSEQGRMLMAVLSSAVRGLNQTEKLIPVLKDLGRRHAGYGLSNLHYETVGAALMLTLETGLGGDFCARCARGQGRGVRVDRRSHTGRRKRSGHAAGGLIAARVEHAE